MAATTIDPRDSTFSAGLAALLGQVQTQRAGVATQRQRGDEDFGTYLRRLAATRAKSLQSTTEGSNDQGLFYSGILGKRLNDVNTGYDQQQSDQTLAHQREGQDLQSQLDQIGTITADPNSPYGYSATGGAGQSLYGLLSDAASRRVAALQNDPVDVPAAPTAAAPAPAAAAPPASSSAAGSGNVLGRGAIPAGIQQALAASALHTAQSGPHAGQQYREQTINGHVWHIYTNGAKVQIS